VDSDPADRSVAFGTAAASRGPAAKNRLLSWQGDITRVLQAGRPRRRVCFCVTHSGWPRSPWRTWKSSVLPSRGPAPSLPVLHSLWVRRGCFLRQGHAAGTRLPPRRAACELRLRGRRGDGRLQVWGATRGCPKAPGRRDKPRFWGGEPGEMRHVGFAAPLPRVTAL